MKQPPTVLKTKKFVASNAAYLSSNNLNAFPINFWVCKQRERQKIFAANLANSPIVAAVKVSSLLLLSSFTSSSHSFFPLTHSLSLGVPLIIFCCQLCGRKWWCSVRRRTWLLLPLATVFCCSDWLMTAWENGTDSLTFPCVIRLPLD